MRQEPPETLIDLLQRLGLATAAEVRGMYSRVRRLARELPLFESVWVDALAQARILTPFQAAEINAGRGDALRVGSYVVCQPLRWPGYAACYAAHEIESRQMVRLTVVQSSPSDRRSIPDAPPRRDGGVWHPHIPPVAGGAWHRHILPATGWAAELVSRLQPVVVKSKDLESEQLAPLEWLGSDGDRVWAASRYVVGQTAAEWMVSNGRFPPGIVLEIARQMVAGLARLEEAKLAHGDIGASGLILTGDGRAVLPDPCLRGVIRPEEGYAHADLPPEAYDYLAPERIACGGPPTSASEVYACGCLWWHLLTGRPPVPGGSSLAKLRAAQTVQIPNLRQLAPDTPDSLAAAVSASVQREPALRPESMVQLAATLGPPTRSGKLALGRCVSRPHHRWGMRMYHRAVAGYGIRTYPPPPAGGPTLGAISVRAIRDSKRTPVYLAAVAGCLLAAVAVTWFTWGTGLPIPVASIPAHPPCPTNRAEADIARRPVSPLAEETRGKEHRTAPSAAAKPQQGPADDRPSKASTLDGSNADDEGSFKDGSKDLVLPAGAPLSGESLELQAGQCVRGRPSQRPLVVVPPAGLDVCPEGLRFENIDFLWNDAEPSGSSTPDQAAVIHLQASRAEFRGCSFQSITGSGLLPVAIRWTHPVKRSEAELSLPSGRVRLSDCVFRELGTALACQTIGSLAVELANVLHLGTGPLVELDHCPKLEEPVMIALRHVTLRGAGPLLECHYQVIDDKPGGILIRADECALVTRGEAALLSFVGPASPQRLLTTIEWTGQGSLVSPDAVVARWRVPDHRVQELDDASVSIAGLVRSSVGFAGPPEAGAAASRVTRWQVPLLSPNPPGIDPQGLPWPQR